MITFDDIRSGDRPWLEELDELQADGYICRFDPAHSVQASGGRCERCGDEMDFRGFELTDSRVASSFPGAWYPGSPTAGCKDPRVALRAFAVCVTCDHWIEF